MHTVTLDGVEYHSDERGFLLRDEDGDAIPAHICICAAHGEHECCCGAWDRPIPNESSNNAIRRDHTTLPFNT